MWLLSTARAELTWFNHAADVQGGYAILSHTWESEIKEQTFQQVSAIGKRCKKWWGNPRYSRSLSDKIRQCCILAEKHGYDWVWIDSCCIDKDSSTELSEAINSMFKWYSQAEVCFAYLADVPTEDNLRAETSAFRNSRWHQRGWTLQELIAPAVVIFMSKDWEPLGTKAELANLVSEITHIPQPILTRKQYYQDTSVANRMWWASRRKTTRPEDQAYCLMGLFDVSMPIIYGEGTRAFFRLQERIMKDGFDMSLFAWGGWISSEPFETQRVRPDLERNVDTDDDLSYLLAPSPASFKASFDFTPLHNHPVEEQRYPPLLLSQEEKDHGAPFTGVKTPTATLENYGVACKFPVFTSEGFVVAVLLCVDQDHQQVGLLLKEENNSYDPHQPLYYTSISFNGTNGMGESENNVTIPVAYRLVTLGSDMYNLRFNGKRVVAHWRTLYIQPRPEERYTPDASIARLTLNCAEYPFFRVPHWIIATIAKVGFRRVIELQEVPHDPGATDTRLPLRLWFGCAPECEHIYLDLGLCSRIPLRPFDHWARVLIHHTDDLSQWHRPLDTHNCAEDHIIFWPEMTKLFGDDRTRGVQLSFKLVPCTPVASSTHFKTLAVHIELKGTVYDNLKA